MPENQEQTSPIFKLDIGGTSVMVRFSSIETPDIKARIRDILTESYEERIQNTVHTYNPCEGKIRGIAPDFMQSTHCSAAQHRV